MWSEWYFLPRAATSACFATESRPSANVRQNSRWDSASSFQQDFHYWACIYFSLNILGQYLIYSLEPQGKVTVIWTPGDKFISLLQKMIIKLRRPKMDKVSELSKRFPPTSNTLVSGTIHINWKDNREVQWKLKSSAVQCSAVQCTVGSYQTGRSWPTQNIF